jgi:exodeoxyribonuclease V alpha subunit
MEQITGLVERVTFHSPESGFCVLRVKVKGQRDLVTIVGHAPSIAPGEYITAGGAWFTDRDHGLQFKATFLRVTPPTTLEGIEKYLGSGMIRGIGPNYSRRLVQAFGETVFEIIEQKPHRLREVPGIGPIRAGRITASYADQKVIREIMVFLHSHGVSTSRAVRIFKTYGADAIAIVSKNPYRLARDIRGIGFRSADTIAQKLGIETTALTRARAGVSHTLMEAMSEGHCGLPRESLLPMAEKLLEIPENIIEQALDLELEEAEVVEDSLGQRRTIFLTSLYRAEQNIASKLHSLLQGRLPWPVIDPEKALPWVERKLNIRLAESQREAVRLALKSKVVVITGGPGVGKTTLVNAILTILRVKQVQVALCAPTGRAAKRLSESTRLEAKTIHRLLEVDPKQGGFSRNERNPLGCDLLVVDESSMVDVSLMHALLRALPSRSALILVGDVDQLPSVGPGQVLADVITSGLIPVVRLTEVFRQAAESRIIISAHRINQGLMPELGNGKNTHTDFYFIEAADPEDAARKILHVAKHRIPQQFGFDPVRDIQVLCPMNRGVCGARTLNGQLQATLNPSGEPRVERFGWTYGAGDKVMQIENDYDKEVYNGDIGLVSAIEPDAQELIIDFDSRQVVYGFDELDHLVLSYATTIHKSQGSEYPVVLVPLVMQHYLMLKRNLIYTAVTRGKQLVVLIGQKKALAIAVKGHQTDQRWSKLADWLRQVGPLGRPTYHS